MRAWGLAAGVVLSFSSVLAACGGDDGGNTPIDAPAAVDAAPGSGRILFLNRAGGTYRPGENDSVANTQGFTQTDVTAPPYPYGDTEWNATRDCVAALFDPFAVTVTDVDPGTVDHVEILVTTTSQVFELPNGVTGVAPADASCTLLERGFAPVFASALGAAATQDVCWVAGSMAGIIYGLDWAMHCPDVMTYFSGCGAKAFRDVTSDCGENQARTCRCGGTTQNSYQFLAGRLGLR